MDSNFDIDLGSWTELLSQSVDAVDMNRLSLEEMHSCKVSTFSFVEGKYFAHLFGESVGELVGLGVSALMRSP